MHTEISLPNTDSSSDLVPIELLFFHQSTELADLPFNLATSIYHSWFGVDVNAYHVLIVVDSYAYEVQTGGTRCIKVENLDFSGLLARWRTEVDMDKALSVARFLERQVSQKRKLQMWESVRYFFQVWHHEVMMMGHDDELLLPSLDEGTADSCNKVLLFNPPYTCASLASEVMTILYPDLELGHLSHLPSHLYMMMIAFTIACDEGTMEIYA